MNTWLNDYGFTMDIIQEACSRTVLSTGQPSFQYADKILSGWKDKNVRTLADVRLLDAQHQRQKLEKNTQRKAAPNRLHQTGLTISISDSTTLTNMKRNC